MAAAADRRQARDPRAGCQLGAQRARRVCARGGPASQGEARRGGRRLRRGSGARDQRHSRSAGTRRRSRHSRAGRRAGTRRRHRHGRRAGRRDARRGVRPDPHRPAVRRSGARADRCRAGQPARASARHDHHGSAGCRRARAREARARGRLVPVGGDGAAGGAHHPERHQPAALRDAQGHHGVEEEGDSRRRSGIAGDGRGSRWCRCMCRRRQSRPKCSLARRRRLRRRWSGNFAKTRG